MKHILIDADTGIDDSIAILYALRCPNIHVEGISTCFGNNNAYQSAENSLRLIKLADCGYDVPVAIGANESIDGVFESSPPFIHGDNGIGNIELPKSSQKPIDETGCDFILRKAEELKGELTIVTLGRMTDLALAYMKDNELPKKVKEVVSMGGTLNAPGNVSNYAEANINGDAHAADVVFRAGFRLKLVGLDVTAKTFYSDREIKNLCEFCRDDCRQIAEYIRDVLKFYFEYYRVMRGGVHCGIVHDPLAMLIAEDPSLGIFKFVRAGVHYKYPEFNGMITTDMGFKPTLDRDEIAVCVEVDSQTAVQRLFSVFQDMTPGRYNKKD